MHFSKQSYLNSGELMNRLNKMAGSSLADQLLRLDGKTVNGGINYVFELSGRKLGYILSLSGAANSCIKLDGYIIDSGAGDTLTGTVAVLPGIHTLIITVDESYTDGVRLVLYGSGINLSESKLEPAGASGSSMYFADAAGKLYSADYTSAEPILAPANEGLTSVCSVEYTAGGTQATAYASVNGGTLTLNENGIEYTVASGVHSAALFPELIAGYYYHIVYCKDSALYIVVRDASGFSAATLLGTMQASKIAGFSGNCALYKGTSGKWNGLTAKASGGSVTYTVTALETLLPPAAKDGATETEFYLKADVRYSLVAGSEAAPYCCADALAFAGAYAVMVRGGRVFVYQEE